MSYSNPYFSGSSQAVSSPNVGLQYLWDGGLNNNNGGWRPITTGDLLTVTLEGAQVNVNLKKDEDTVNIYTDKGQGIDILQTGDADNFNTNANLQVGDTDVSDSNPVPVKTEYLNDSIETFQFTHDNLNANVNLQVGDADVSDSNPVPVKTEYLNDSIETFQFTHDNLNANVNLQVGDADVSDSNPVPVKTDYQNDSIEVFQTGHDNLNANANLQIGDADVSVSNPVNTQPVCPVLSNDESLFATTASFNGNGDIDNGVEYYSLQANTRGSAGNKTITGNGLTTMSAFASQNNFTANSGNTNLVPDNGTAFSFTGGADATKAGATLNGILYEYYQEGAIGNTKGVQISDGSALSHYVGTYTIQIFINTGTTSRGDLVNYITNNVTELNALTTTGGTLAQAGFTQLSNGSDGDFAIFTGSIAVESKYQNIQITANSSGSSGNVTLTGDDTSTITDLVNAHNGVAGNTQLTVNLGGPYVLNNGASIALNGGSDAVSTAQEFHDSTNNFYYTKHSYVIKLKGTGSSASADVTFLVKNNGINDFASIKNETVTWNPSTDGDQYLTYFDEFNFSFAKVFFDLDNCTVDIAETHTG